jgi:hypothetical protein
MKEDYNKTMRIKRLSNFVGCLKKFQSGNISLLLIIVHFITIILCVMNLFIIPWKNVKTTLLVLRIIVLVFLGIELISISFNMIFSKRQKLGEKIFFCIGFYGSIISIISIVLNFIFILISVISVTVKIKASGQKTNVEFNSILTIEIGSLIIFLIEFFLWYYEIIVVYGVVKYDESIKEFVERKLKFLQSQNEKVVNVELSSKIHDNIFNSRDMPAKHLEEDSTSNNRIELSGDKIVKKENDDSKINERKSSNAS